MVVDSSALVAILFGDYFAYALTSRRGDVLLSRVMIFRKPTSDGLLISHEGQPPASRAEAAVRTETCEGG